jgi:hypothetical protein
MTVKELIKKLAGMPKNADVCFYNSDYNYTVCVSNKVDFDDVSEIVYLMQEDSNRQATVNSLIEKLSAMDNNADVCFYYSDYEYSESISGTVEYDDDLDDVFIM